MALLGCCLRLNLEHTPEASDVFIQACAAHLAKREVKHAEWEALDEPLTSNGEGSLSEKLERSEGVITPPASGTDPGIVQPTPDTGETKMPVIPPPGTPGGDPNVRPQ
jgi:hypothetical protein